MLGTDCQGVQLYHHNSRLNMRHPPLFIINVLLKLINWIFLNWLNKTVFISPSKWPKSNLLPLLLPPPPKTPSCPWSWTRHLGTPGCTVCHLWICRPVLLLVISSPLLPLPACWPLDAKGPFWADSKSPQDGFSYKTGNFSPPHLKKAQIKYNLSVPWIKRSHLALPHEKPRNETPLYMSVG